MNINEYGAVFLTPEELFEGIYANKIKNFDNIYLDEKTVTQFNTAKNINKDNFENLSVYTIPTVGIKEFDKINQDNWFIGEYYKDMDINKWLLDRCLTEIETNRVTMELNLFAQHNMMTVLKYLKYLVDNMRQHNVMWGVGRGSSVASYCLYLIGIHKINSIKYNLDINEFLK